MLRYSLALGIHSLHMPSMGDKKGMNWPSQGLAFYGISHSFNYENGNEWAHSFYIHIGNIIGPQGSLSSSGPTFGTRRLC